MPASAHAFLDLVASFSPSPGLCIPTAVLIAVGRSRRSATSRTEEWTSIASFQTRDKSGPDAARPGRESPKEIRHDGRWPLSLPPLTRQADIRTCMETFTSAVRTAPRLTLTARLLLQKLGGAPLALPIAVATIVRYAKRSAAHEA